MRKLIAVQAKGVQHDFPDKGAMPPDRNRLRKQNQNKAAMNDHKTDSQNLQMEIQKPLSVLKMMTRHGLLPNKNHGKTLHQRDSILGEILSGIAELNRITELLLSESIEYPDYLPKSFCHVEIHLAECISKCLQDVDSEKRSIEQIRLLLREYKVVRLLPAKNCSVSLEAVYLILQDSFPDSCLRGFLNIILGNFHDVQTKVVTFY